MSTLHPNWQSEEAEVPVRSAKTQSSNCNPAIEFPSVTSISRKPAALMGILLVASLGLAYFHGFSSLRGQVANDPFVIHITETGIEPRNLTVAKGDEVRWINEDDMPHILESVTLCNAGTDCLSTSTLFPGEEASYVIPMDLIPGVYGYHCTIESHVKGEFTVVDEVAIAPTPPEPKDDSPKMFDPAPRDPPQPPAFPSSWGTINPTTSDNPPVATPPKAPPLTQNAAIPTNPNSGKQFTAQTTTTSTHTAPPAVTGHKPFRQPNTGVGMWVTALMFLMSIGGLVWRVRRV